MSFVDVGGLKEYVNTLLPTRKKKIIAVWGILTVFVFLSRSLWLFLCLIWGFTTWAYLKELKE